MLLKDGETIMTTVPRNTINNLKKIIDSLVNGKTVKFHDVAGHPHETSLVQGIRKEGGKDMWLVTIQGKEVCVKAA